MVKKLKFFVDSDSSTPIPNLLFTGSQGLGKTFMADKVAKALGRELVEINCSTVETTKNFIEDLLWKRVAGNISKTLLFDESHKLSSEVTTALLILLNPSNDNKNRLLYKDCLVEYDFHKVNSIFATTDAHRMFRPLVDRCVEIYFKLYDNEDLYNILKLYLPEIKLRCNPEDLAYACRGRARDAFLLANNIKRYCMKNNISDFDDNGWKDIKDIFDINSLGINEQEITLLKILKESSPLSCGNIAIKMGVNEDNVSSEIEVRPRELGLIESGTRGRILTQKGMEYLENIR